MSTANDPSIRPRSWTWGIGRVSIALFLSVIYLDPLPNGTLNVGGLGASVVGAVAGGLLAFGLLYYPVVMWGHTSRRPLHDLAGSAFGQSGAQWLSSVSLGVAHVLWFAVALNLAADYGARGLINLGLIEPSDVAERLTAGIPMKAPVVLFEVACWSIFAAVMGTLAVRIVSAVMYTYPVFSGLALAIALLWTTRALDETPLGSVPTLDPNIGAPWMAALAMIQWIGGFYVAPGLLSAEWGGVSRSVRDIRLGGVVGVAVASLVLAVITLIVVEQTLGPRTAPPNAIPEVVRTATAEERLASLLRNEDQGVPPRTSPPAGASPTLALALQYGVGGRLGGVLLLVFALGLLAPCGFAPFVYVREFERVFPVVPRLAIGLAGALLTWPLVALGWVDQPQRVANLLGAFLGPLAGVLAADFVRHRGSWPGARAGWNWSAVWAWSLGVPISAASELGPRLGFPALSMAQPGLYLGFSVSFLLYLLVPRRPGDAPLDHRDAVVVEEHPGAA